MTLPTTVWLSPSATAFSCLDDVLFAEALRVASVRGSIARETDVAVVRCTAGHELVLRRVERPPGLLHPDDRQLQIA
jgi:hypothetical protein